MKTRSKNSSTAKNTKASSRRRMRIQKISNSLLRRLESYSRSYMMKKRAQLLESLTRDRRTSQMTRREKKSALKLQKKRIKSLKALKRSGKTTSTARLRAGMTRPKRRFMSR